MLIVTGASAHTSSHQTGPWGSSSAWPIAKAVIFRQAVVVKGGLLLIMCCVYIIACMKEDSPTHQSDNQK